MTIDERIDETVDEKTERFLQIMDRVTDIIFEIRDLEVKDPRDVIGEGYFNDIFKQARHVLQAAQATVETIIGVNFISRYQGTE